MPFRPISSSAGLDDACGCKFAAQAEQQQANKPFLVTTNRTLSYGELHKRMAQLETLYRRSGFRQGDRVLLAVRDDVETSIFLLSLQRSGLTVTLFDPEATISEFDAAVETSRPSAIVTDEDLHLAWNLERYRSEVFLLKVVACAQRGRNLASRLLRRQAPKTNSPQSYPELLNDLEESPLPAVVDPESAAWIIFTSGTTSRPKGVEMSRRAQLSHLRTLSRVFDYDSSSHLLNVLPMHHADGSIQGPVLAYFNGATLHRPCTFSAASIPKLLDSIYAERITHFIAVPTMLSLILRLGSRMADAFETDDFQMVVSAAARLDEKLWLDFEAHFGATVCNLYGLTETVTGSIFSGPCEPTRRVGSIGKPVDCEVELVDEDGRKVAVGETGQIVISGDHLMKGYFGNPEATAQAVSDGRLHTGDLARFDEQGFLYIVGRAKDVIISGGHNISPDEVNSALEAHPCVIEAATIGVPDAEWGEKTLSIVVVEPGSGINAAELISHCRNILSAYKLPRRIVLAQALPRGPSGKVVQEELRSFVERESIQAGATSAADLLPIVIGLAARCLQTTSEHLNIASGPETSVGWDSLTHMELVSALEGAFSISLSSRDIMAIDSIGAAVSIVQKRLDSSPLNPLQTCAHVAC